MDVRNVGCEVTWIEWLRIQYNDGDDDDEHFR
jgi:hypothetical protein